MKKRESQDPVHFPDQLKFDLSVFLNFPRAPIKTSIQGNLKDFFVNLMHSSPSARNPDNMFFMYLRKAEIQRRAEEVYRLMLNGPYKNAGIFAPWKYRKEITQAFKAAFHNSSLQFLIITHKPERKNAKRRS